MNVNAIIYVSPIIDFHSGQYFIDWVEMVNGKLTIKEAHYNSLIEADNAKNELKKEIKNI